MGGAVVTIDALAFEPHFVDHLRPIWRELPADLRGAFVVDATLEDHARRRGLEVELADGPAIRRTIRYPLPDPGPGPVALVASYGDIKIGRRMGYRRFAFLEHGAGQSYGGDRRHRAHGSYAGGEDREDVGLFLVPNDHAAGRWRRAYPDARIETVGCPKLEDLPPRSLDPVAPSPVVAIGFHWDCHIVPETRSAYGHFRTAIPELARRFALIGHGHPRAADWLPRVYRNAGVEWVPDFEEVSRRADLYVCDNSSTLFEFAATGRPVVVLNAPWYRRNVEHGLRFWQAATVGIQVDDPRELVAAAALALEDPAPVRDAREEALRLVYTFRYGAAERAAEAIAGWLEEVGDPDERAASRSASGSGARRSPR